LVKTCGTDGIQRHQGRKLTWVLRLRGVVLPDQKGVAEVVPDGQWTIPQLTKILNSTSLDKNFITA
jgi:hypothetical protein